MTHWSTVVVYISVIILKMFFVISSPEESKCSQYLEVAVDSLCDMDLCVTLSFSLLILFCAISKRGLCVCVCAYACMSVSVASLDRTYQCSTAFFPFIFCPFPKFTQVLLC